MKLFHLYFIWCKCHISGFKLCVPLTPSTNNIFCRPESHIFMSLCKEDFNPNHARNNKPAARSGTTEIPQNGRLTADRGTTV